MVKKTQGKIKASKLSVPLQNSRRDSSSSESSSIESFTTLSFELSSFTSITNCSCLSSSTDKCDYYINKKKQNKTGISQMKIRKKLSKRKNPSKVSTTASKKLGNQKNSKNKTQKVSKEDKEFVEDSCLSDSSNDCDCNSCYTHYDCKHYSNNNKQKNKRKTIIPSKSRGKITKAATTYKSLENRKISKKSAIKPSEKKKTSLFDPCSCNSRNTKSAKGSSKNLRESKKSIRNAKSLTSKKVSKKMGSSERFSSSFSSEDTDEFFSSDEDTRGHCCGNIRDSRRKIKY